MMKEYSTGDLMAAILTLQDATAGGFTNLESKLTAKIDSEVGNLRHEMNRRFDRVDARFDRLEVRVEALERQGNRPAI
jgi:hypothetical protein